MNAGPRRCPLCHARRANPFVRAHGRQYLQCGICRLVHVPPEARLDPAAEAARYRTHRNDPGDAGYREFLSRLAGPLADRLPFGAQGLDYGSGPGPTLSVMLEARGLKVALYDPFFAPDEVVLHRTYDFVTCTETAEHFFDPRHEFDRLQGLVRPGGWLALMTALWTDGLDFTAWHYARDRTHVCFYHRETVAWLARRYHWQVNQPHETVVLFHKA